MADDDLLRVLTRFHREVVMPDVKGAVREAVEQSEQRLRDEMLSHFDAVYKRFDRLEAEYQALAAAVARIERRLGDPESDDEKRALQDQIRDLKQKVTELQRRLDELETAS